MATTNLISKSLGDILTESGTGTPDHISPKGSIYVNTTNGSMYQNRDGSTAWLPLNAVAYGEAYYQDNVTATTIAATPTWSNVNNTFTSGSCVGFYTSGSTLVVKSGYDGNYEIRGDVTISYVGGTNNYEVGLSINGSDPTPGTYDGSQIDVTYTRQHIGFTTIKSLSGETRLSFKARTLNSTNNVIIRHAQLVARRVGGS